jgi:signal transduction histidine kinase/CheY-like chemotaxis protein
MRLFDVERAISELDLWIGMDSHIRTEQIAALFRNIAWAVIAAAVGAAGLTLMLSTLHVVEPWGAWAWNIWIVNGAILHLLLRRAWYRSQTPGDRRRWWPSAFVAISLFEGLGWGWAPLHLVKSGHYDGVLLVLTVTLSATAASISAFSAYLPAFAAFFLSATVPYAIASFGASTSLERASFPLMVLYIIGIGGLGIMANRSFRELVRLRLQTSALAEALQAQKEVAERANLAKSSFLAAASHDLRQPVHALGLFVGALRNLALPRDARRLVEQIEMSAGAMDTLFSALLDISRLDAGVVEVRPKTFPLQPLIERLCREHAAEADEKGIVLIWRPTRAQVRSDPVLVERILRNLISNAVRYTQKGGVLVGCRGRETVRVEVWDTGPGIPTELHEQVFQEYFQLANPERDRTKGLGLGLAIVRRLVALLQSDLLLRSRSQHGSCFSITLPRVDAPEGAVESADEAPVGGALSRGHVLVVDDEVAICEAMSALLSGWGYRVTVAHSGAEALAASDDAFDMIICDYRLREGETGIGVIARVRERGGAAIPAMLITGDTAPDRLAEAQASGLVLLHKPVSNGKLRAAMVNLMQSQARAPDRDGREVERVR